MKRFLIAISAVLAIAGCSHNKVNFDPSTSTLENEKGGLSGNIVWLKNKSKGVDLLIHFYNGYNHDVVMKQNSFVLEYQGQKYAMRSEGGDVYVRAGMHFEKLAIFPFYDQRERSGEVTLTIDPIMNEKDNSKLNPMKFVLPLQQK